MSFVGQATVLGVNQRLGDRGLPDLDCTLGRMAANHLGLVRGDLAWSTAEPAPNRYDFSWYDAVLSVLANHRMRWLPVVLGAPSFRQRHRGSAGGIAPPANPWQFAAFMRILVRRYGPNGSFWRAHPHLPYLPIRAWQIWNEPSLPSYWSPRPSPAGYTALLQAASIRVKQIDPRAVIVAAGMPFYAGVQFYQQMYRLGAGPYFDVAAFNDYSAQPRYAEEYLILLRQLMNGNGDGHKPMWVTEFGWASSGPPSPFRAGRATPRKVSRLLSWMVANRQALGLRRIIYFDWRDPAGTRLNWWGVNMGLYRVNDTPRPVWGVIASAASRLNR